MEEASTKQTSLFGGFVEEDKPTLTFVKVYEEVVSEGDQFTMHPTTAKFNEDRGCLTLIDANKNQALTVYFEHAENARYTSRRTGCASVEPSSAVCVSQSTRSSDSSSSSRMCQAD